MGVFCILCVSRELLNCVTQSSHWLLSIEIKVPRIILNKSGLFSCPAKSLSVCLSFCLSVCRSVFLSVCQSVCPSFCLSVHPSFCPSFCPSVRPSVCPSVPSVRPSVCPSFFLSVCLSVRPSVCLSVLLSVCLSVRNILSVVPARWCPENISLNSSWDSD